MMELDADLLSALIAFASLMVGGAYFLSRKIERIDERDRARVKDLHQRVDNAILNMVSKQDHAQDVGRIETAVNDGIREIRGTVERLLTRQHQGQSGD